MELGAIRGIPFHKQDILDTVQFMMKQQGRKTPFTNDRPSPAWIVVRKNT